MSVRRASAVLLAVLILGAAGWAGRWWWRATHPIVAEQTPPGWVPAVVIAAGHRAALHDPFGVALSANGIVYVTVGGDAPAVGIVTADGDVQTLAGGTRGYADGAGAAAAFDTPSHLAVGPDGTIYVADTGNHAIRRVTPGGHVSTVAGDGISGAGDGHGARLRAPVGVAVTADGRVVVADTYNDRILILGASGASGAWSLRTLAGSGVPGLVDGVGTAAAFDTPTGVAALPDGSVIVADTGNDALRRIAADGTVTTVSSIGLSGSADLLWRPLGVAAGSGGRLYVTDARARVVELVPDGGRRVLAGSVPGFSAGVGTAALMREPAGIAVAPDGRVVVADTLNGLIRVLDLPDRLGPWWPAPPRLAPGFDLTRFARVPLVWPLDPQDGPHEVAGTLGEPRGNPGGSGRERFHAGVDVRADLGAPVLAIRDGVFTSVISTGAIGTLSEYVSIGPITYVHVRAGRGGNDTPIAGWATVVADPVTGKPAHVRVPRGTRIRTGEVLGTVNRFRHVHLNVGPPGEEANALLVGLPAIVDTVPPVVAPAGITVTDLAGRALTDRVDSRVLITGPVRIIVDAYDRMDDSPPRRRLGLYRVGYQVLRADGTTAPGFGAPHIAITFDRLPPAPEAPPLLYAPGSGIPFYGARVSRYRYLVTSRVEHGTVVESPWVPQLPPGDYVVRVVAEDAAGNVAIAGRDLPIRIAG